MVQLTAPGRRQLKSILFRMGRAIFQFRFWESYVCLWFRLVETLALETSGASLDPLSFFRTAQCDSIPLFHLAILMLLLPCRGSSLPSVSKVENQLNARHSGTIKIWNCSKFGNGTRSKISYLQREQSKCGGTVVFHYLEIWIIIIHSSIPVPNINLIPFLVGLKLVHYFTFNLFFYVLRLKIMTHNEVFKIGDK